jgi:hypothetical protein
MKLWLEKIVSFDDLFDLVTICYIFEISNTILLLINIYMFYMIVIKRGII